MYLCESETVEGAMLFGVFLCQHLGYCGAHDCGSGVAGLGEQLLMQESECERGW